MLSSKDFVMRAAYYEGCKVNHSILEVIAAGVVLLSLDSFRMKGKFLSRKLMHIVSSLMLIYFHQPCPESTLCMYHRILGVSLCVIVLLRDYYYRRTLDKGLLGYGIVYVTIVVYNLQPMMFYGMFFADPIGALVGHYMSKQVYNPCVYKKKTLMGTMAVFLVSSIMSYFLVGLFMTNKNDILLTVQGIYARYKTPDELETIPLVYAKIVYSFGCGASLAGIELLGGDNDNLLMSVPAMMHVLGGPQMYSVSLATLPLALFALVLVEKVTPKEKSS